MTELNQQETTDLLLLKKRSIASIIALSSRTFVLQLISFGTFLAVASLLSVADIGIYTAVIAIQKIISFFTDFGLGPALIQKKEGITDSDIATVFTLQSVLTLSIFIIVFLASGFIASIFRLNQQGVVLLLVLVFTVFLSSFKTIPSILLERGIRFEKLVIPQMVESIVFNLLLIVFLMNNFQLASYSIAFLVSSIIGIPAYYAVSPWKLRLGVNKTSIHHLKFGLQYQAKNVLATLKDDLLTVFLTQLLTYVQIGYIGFAQKISFFVYRYVVDSVTKVTFSTYARIQDNTVVLRTAIEKSLFFVGAVMTPVSFGLIVIAPYLIRYFPNWYPKWEGALFSIVFFSLNAVVSSFSGVLVNILDSTGKVNITLKLMMLWTILIWILTPIGILMFGYNAVAIASFLVTLTIVITVYQVKRVVEFSFIKSVYKPFVSSIGMSIIVYFVAQAVASDLLSLIFVILIGAGMYSFLLYVIAKKELISELPFFLRRYEQKK